MDEEIRALATAAGRCAMLEKGIDGVIAIRVTDGMPAVHLREEKWQELFPDAKPERSGHRMGTTVAGCFFYYFLPQPA